MMIFKENVCLQCLKTNEVLFLNSIQLHRNCNYCNAKLLVDKDFMTKETSETEIVSENYLGLEDTIKSLQEHAPNEYRTNDEYDGSVEWSVRHKYDYF